MQVWTYWDGPMPEVYRAMLETVRWHNPGVRVLGRTDAQAIVNAAGWDVDLAALAPNHASDVVRFAILSSEGGIWVDADTICFEPLGWLAEMAEQFEFVTTRAWPNMPRLATALMAATPDCDALRGISEQVHAGVRRGEMRWSTIGPNALHRSIYAARRRASVCVICGKSVAPLNWSSTVDRRSMAQPPTPAIVDHLRRSRAKVQVLTHECLAPFLGMSRQELRTDTRLVPYMIREAFVEHRGRWVA